jgi:putative sterol carrier protein
MMADIVPYLEQICTRISQPDMRAALRDFTKTVQFIFPDLQRNFTISIAQNGNAALTEQTVPQPDITVTTSSDTLAGIMNNTIHPFQAYITHKLKVDGDMQDLLKLQKLL